MADTEALIAEARKASAVVDNYDGDRYLIRRLADALEAALLPAPQDAIPAQVSGEDDLPCPICAEPFKPDDLCATDIEMGTCHAACLEGSPVVDLETGDPSDGPIATFRYDPKLDADKANRWPLLKKALWHVVTGENLNDGHYINAYDLTDKLYAATLSAQDAPSASLAGWRDIATAPKDGTRFLALEGTRHYDCWWHDAGYGEAYWQDEADSEPNPHKWMPLPASPEQGEAP